jgi:Zn-dependent protease
MSIIAIVIEIFVLLFAITVHEASHGWAANRMGDPTAFNMGRITLNPLAHIDLIGTVIVPLIILLAGFPPFGWAKPVPVNPYNLRHPRRDNIWISFAGPAANGLTAFGAFVILLVLKALSPGVNQFLRIMVRSMLKNPDVLRSILPHGLVPLQGLALVLYFVVFINIYLAVFNLIPIPPLDGSGILMGVLPEEAAMKYDRIRPFGFLIVIGLVYLGLLNLILIPIQLFIDVLLG